MTTDMAGSTVLDSIKALRQNFQRDEASGAHMTELKLRNAQLEVGNVYQIAGYLPSRSGMPALFPPTVASTISSPPSTPAECE